MTVRRCWATTGCNHPQSKRHHTHVNKSDVLTGKGRYFMDYSNIIAEIDAEITKLQQARALLSDVTTTVAAVKRGRGRPKGVSW